MKAEDVQLVQLLDGAKQFIVPVFQRDYSWETKHCLQLWNDIMQAGATALVKAHFVGSIVYRSSARARRSLPLNTGPVGSITWGQPHQTRPVEPQIKDLDYILHRNAGVNIYMFHGGTSFGMMSGSSWTNDQLLPDVTSDDYDAPLDEAGHPTPKSYAYPDEIARYLGHPLPLMPSPPPVAAIAPFTLTSASVRGRPARRLPPSSHVQWRISTRPTASLSTASDSTIRSTETSRSPA